MTQKNSIDLYKRFYDLSNDMLCIINSDGYFAEVNASFCRHLNFDQNNVSRLAFIDYIHPDDIAETTQKIRECQQNSSVYNFKNRFKVAKNTYRSLSWSVTLDKETGLFYTSARDVTEQVNVKNELRQLKSAISNETIYAETDIKGNITKVNDKFCDISGYTKTELIGQNHRIINSGFHPKAFFTNIWKRISSGKVWTGAIQNKAKNGDYYFVQSILIPILDHNNKIIKYISTRQDITPQINSDFNYRKTLNILSETSAIGKIGGWELHIESGDLLWTDETFNILGVDKNSGVRPMLPEGIKLFIEEDQLIIDEAVRRAREFGEPYSLELQACTPKGEIKWVYTTGKANYKNGIIETISGIIKDIHDVKIAKIKLAESQQRSLHNAKFAALGELSASIAHEINNPLGVISGYAELMKIQASASSQKQFLPQTNIILKSCGRIAHIVKSLKKFSKNYKLEPKKVHSIKDIVNEVIALTRPQIKQKNISLKISAIEDGLILCNEVEIEQVLVNLINNAIEAIAHINDKHIELSVKNSGKSLIFAITDSGAGIPEKDQLLIFDPFYTTKALTNGTGLGLSIAKEILNEHNANIRINNAIKGTCFEIDFPKYNSTSNE